MRLPKLLPLILMLAAASAVAQPSVQGVPAPQVRTATGAIAGAALPDRSGAVFLGIPFAEPPVGALRWRPPVEAKRWSGVRSATAPGAACVQVSGNGLSGAEDCLYLNVWAPEWPVKARRPVMLWMFGGANWAGSANNPVFDGAALAKAGVVVVTANVRVGAMGFLAHPALSAESPHGSSGNYTLLDQIAVLRWIRANIAGFGGDPANVTMFGQSSGSYDILLLMGSPLAKGLFHRAIAESGQFLAYDGPMPKARAEAIGSAVAADLGIPAGPDQLARLRAVPPAQLIAAAAKRMPTAPGSDTGLLTNVDGWVLPEPPARTWAAGREMRIPLILGTNAREIGRDVPPDDLRRQIVDRYGPALGAKAIAAYGLADGAAGAVDPLLGSAGAQWWTDTVQRCAAKLEVEWHAAAGNPTWQYQFERSIPGREATGASHGAEVAFVFGTLDRVGPDKPTFTAADARASAEIGAYWTRFAHAGDPNGGGLPAWPRAGGGDYLAFAADGPVARRNLQPGPCGVYREWMLDRLGK